MGSQRVGCDFVVVEQEQRTVEPLGECCVCVCVCEIHGIDATLSAVVSSHCPEISLMKLT